jgi:hypothetical protein
VRQLLTISPRSRVYPHQRRLAIDAFEQQLLW